MTSGGLWVSTGVPGGHCGVTPGRACPPVPQLTAERRSARAAGNGLGTDPPRLGDPPLQGMGARGTWDRTGGALGGTWRGLGVLGGTRRGWRGLGGLGVTRKGWGSPARGQGRGLACLEVAFAGVGQLEGREGGL